jgi:hypothetical protein
VSGKAWTDKQDTILEQHYNTEPKAALMAATGDRTWTALNARAKRLHLPKRMWAAEHVNVKFFDTWSNEMAYVLGFVAADGCVSDNGHLKIGLSSKDHSHLEKIRDMISPTSNIRIVVREDGNSLSSVDIGSKYMTSRLNALGITPRKSLTLKFPSIPEQYLSHFVRGYFDGDGSMTTCHGHLQVDFCAGGPDFLPQLSTTIDALLGLGTKNIKFNASANAFYLDYTAKQATLVCEWMYRDSTIHLDRKYDRFQAMNHYSNRLSYWRRNEDEFLIANYLTMPVKEIMKTLDRSRNSISCRANRLNLKKWVNTK